MRQLVVQQNVLGGWDVRDALGGDAPLFRGTRADAEQHARSLCTEAGGSVTVLGPTGGTLDDFSTDAPPPAAAAVPQLDLDTLLVRGAGLAVAGAAKAGVPGAQQIKAEGRLVNQIITVTAWACGGAVGSTLLSPQVISLGRSWQAVFVATLTWSLGLCVAVLLIRGEKLNGWPAAVGAAASLLGALLLAQQLGVGVLEISLAEPTNPLGTVLLFAQQAFLTYGPVGAVLSGGIGLWLGWRLSDPGP